MADNDIMDLEEMRSNRVLEKERRKRMELEDRQQMAEERFKQQFAKELAESRNGIAKEIRDAVDRSKSGDSWFKNQKYDRNDSRFDGVGVTPDEV